MKSPFKHHVTLKQSCRAGREKTGNSTAMLQEMEVESTLTWSLWVWMFAGTECQSVLGGGRPSDSPGPAVRARHRAPVERSGWTLTHLCGQPTHSDGQKPAGTHTQAHTHKVKDGCLRVNITFGVETSILRTPSWSFLSDTGLSVTKGTGFVPELSILWPAVLMGKNAAGHFQP